MCEKYREVVLIVDFTDQSNEDGRKLRTKETEMGSGHDCRARVARLS